MILKLIGFKTIFDKEDTNAVKGYHLSFLRDSRENGDGEYGNLCKNVYVFPNQIPEVHLSVGSLYNVFTAYESTTKKELFAGMIKVEGDDKK